MTEEHENQLKQFEQFVHNIIGKIVSTYAVRFTWVVVVSAFSVGCWMTKMHNNISMVLATQEELKAEVKDVKVTVVAGQNATMARIVDWSQWRVVTDWNVTDYQKRITWLESVERARRSAP